MLFSPKTVKKIVDSFENNSQNHLLTWKIIKINSNNRLDTVIIKHCHDLGYHLERNQLHKIFMQAVTVNQTVTKKSYKVKLNDVISFNYDLYLHHTEEIKIIAQPIDIEILYEDDDLMIVNKSKNLVVHPSRTCPDGTLLNGLLFHTKKLSNVNGVTRLGIVHRLDKDTTGLLVVAKNNKTHNALAQQIQNRTMSRQYLAITHGHLENQKNKIDAPLGRSKSNRILQDVKHALNPKPAVTYVFVKERLNNFDLVRCQLETGRTHQIRAHLKFIHHPILGDHSYGFPSDKNIVFSQFLHAFLLKFKHPSTGEMMSFYAEPPYLFKQQLQKLKIH